MLTSALFAGVATGLLATLLQFAFVIPLLLEGELYETGARIHFAADGSPQSDAGAPGLGYEWGRHLMTLTFNVITFTAYALILAALFGFARLRGVEVTARRGVVWGLAGFVAVQFAPALGLPPELPGTITPEVGPRQVWWSLTILATAAALGLFAFTRGIVPVLAGVVLILAPHVIGAPHLDTYYGIAPPELAASFATRSLGAAAAAWVLLGVFTACFWTRLEPKS